MTENRKGEHPWKLPPNAWRIPYAPTEIEEDLYPESDGKTYGGYRPPPLLDEAYTGYDRNLSFTGPGSLYLREHYDV